MSVHPEDPTRELVRSANDRMLAGVCGGIAAGLGVPASTVRFVAVLALVSVGPAAAFVYVVLGTFLREAQTPAHAAALSVDWQPERVHMAWRGPATPHATPWSAWWRRFGAVTLVAIAGVVALGLGAAPEVAVVGTVALTAALGPLGLGALLLARFPRRWALTVTQPALWVEAPGLPARRVLFEDVEGIHVIGSSLTVQLRSGEVLGLAPTPDSPDVDAVFDELLHRLELATSDPETRQTVDEARRRLEAVARRAAAVER